MARWIDMTDAQKGAKHQALKAQRRAKLLANPAPIVKSLADIEVNAAAALADGWSQSSVDAFAADERRLVAQGLMSSAGLTFADLGIAS